MSIYNEKLIELLSIEQKFDKSFLHIKLLFNQEIELHWEIDNETANLMKSKIILDENYKFSLSLCSTWDEDKNQFTSFVTKSNNNESEKIYFSCSEEFHLQLHSIKNMKDLRILIDLPYLSISRSSTKKEKINSKRYKLYGWLTVAAISILSISLIAYKSQTCKSESLFCGKKPAKAESVSKAQNTKSPEKPIKTNQDKHDPKKTDIKNVSQPNVHTNEPDVRYAIKQEPINKPFQSIYPNVKLNNVVNYSIPPGSVALTFDDGPSKYSKEIVNVLKKYKVGGTFFYIGNNVQRYPDCVQYAYSNGYSVGSHSMHHNNFLKLSYKNQEDDLVRTSNLITNITKQETTLFRPPYGAKNQATIELMQKHQFKMVLWDKDTEDWKNRNTNTIINYVKSHTESGSIILLHETKPSLDALPQIIEYLQSKNLKIVSLN
ncbi:polysaccharide deacetylase family protein [Gottfriedia acidiceleris]|uniref:polysaccharide deacetylase family protein n=1 Tax=Gottfriedia acidiceleris TaxID=371036 RepID=UPI003397A5B1